MANKSMYKNELARAAGVSLSTFSAWLRNDQDIMRSLNLSKRAEYLFDLQTTQQIGMYFQHYFAILIFSQISWTHATVQPLHFKNRDSTTNLSYLP